MPSQPFSVSAVDINISGTGSSYSAYRILNLSQGVKPGHSETGECSAEDCDKANDPDSHWNYAYSLNEKYTQVLLTVFADLGMDDIEESNLIATVQEFDSDAVRVFADELYKRIKTLAPEYTSDDNKFAGVDPGYYLIAETGTAGPGDSVSLVMLDTAGLDEVRVSSEESAPTLEKKIVAFGDDGAAKYMDGFVFNPDHVVVWYELTAELHSEDISEDILSIYDRIVFHDDISEGLLLNYWAVDVYEFVPGKIYPVDGGLLIGDSILCQVLTRQDGDAMLDDKCELEVTVPLENGYAQPPREGPQIAYQPTTIYDGPHKIVVRYLCELADDAVTGAAGNPNTAHLEFSNNLYDDSSTGNTPDDKVSVFVAGLRVNKTDGSKPLPGAEFELFKYMGTREMPESLLIDDSTSGEYSWVLVDTLDGIDGSDEGFDATVFETRGLGAGRYKLVETVVPDGYQKADDIIFEIVMEAEEVSDDPKLTKLDIVDENGESLMQGEDAMFYLEPETGMFVTNVVNYTGAKLPSTGGAGVYGVYMTGAMMVALAGAVMVCAMKGKKKEDV